MMALLLVTAPLAASAFVGVGAATEAGARRGSHAHMLVDAVESTPNPSSFLLRLDSPLDGLAPMSGLQGVTFRKSEAGSTRCPGLLTQVLNADGVDSVFAMTEMLTVNKLPSASWEAVLPQVIEALGGSTEKLGASGLPSIGADAPAPPAVGGVTIRLQVSQSMPIQVEATGWMGAAPVRAKLSSRFGSAMGLLIGESGDAFFAGRAWLDRGVRYPEPVVLAPSDPLASERQAVEATLQAELAEVEAAYPDDRLASIIFGAKSQGQQLPPRSAAAADGEQLSLADVDRLCDEDAALEARGEIGLTPALRQLAQFVASGEGVLGARRNAVAYLGGSGRRGGDEVFDAVAATFRTAKAAGLRRTAGDALSDLGDGRAVPLATAALADRASLVRWRAARILGELGGDADADADTDDIDGVATFAALKQARLEEEAFEVAFEMQDAMRKVQLRTEGSDGGARGPMWRQIQEGRAGAHSEDT